MMDYKKLLEAYIDSIISHEGTPFVENLRGEVNGIMSHIDLTDEESREIADMCDERWRIEEERRKNDKGFTDEEYDKLCKFIDERFSGR